MRRENLFSLRFFLYNVRIRIYRILGFAGCMIKNLENHLIKKVIVQTTIQCVFTIRAISFQRARYKPPHQNPKHRLSWALS